MVCWFVCLFRFWQGAVPPAAFVGCFVLISLRCGGAVSRRRCASTHSSRRRCARTHARSALPSCSVLCRIMLGPISACRAVSDQHCSSSQHFRFQSEALVYGDEIGNVFFTQPFEERSTKARDMTMQRRTWRATLHAACNIVRGMCSRRRGTACAMHGRCHGASCAGRDSARTASSSISYTPTGLPRLAAPFLPACTHPIALERLNRNAMPCKPWAKASVAETAR